MAFKETSVILSSGCMMLPKFDGFGGLPGDP